MPDAAGEPHNDQQSAAQLAELLRRLGATEDEIAATVGPHSGGDFALDLVLRRGAPVPLQEALAQTASSAEEFGQFWQALGFTAPGGLPATVPRDLVDALPILARATQDVLGAETALGIARVLGNTAARLAEALVDAFRVQFEVPELTSGTSYAEVVESYVSLVREMLPSFELLVSAVVRAHLVRVANGTWAIDPGQRAARRELFVGFVDLVGYTAISRTLSTSELAALLGRFEEVVSGVVNGHGCRLVKLIGDGAMFVTDQPGDGCAAALELVARLDASETLPPARVGADCGTVLSLYGDYFGDVVNRAARLVALANPGTVVVSEAFAALADPAFRLEQLPAQALKGFLAPAVSYRLQPAG